MAAGIVAIVLVALIAMLAVVGDILDVVFYGRKRIELGSLQ